MLIVSFPIPAHSEVVAPAPSSDQITGFLKGGHIYTYGYMCVYVYTYIYMYTYVYMCIHIYICKMVISMLGADFELV